MSRSKEDEVSFGEARERLDEILEEVEREEIDVDRLAERVREASALIRLCRERLSAARLEVDQVVAELREAAEAPAAPAADEGARDEAPPPPPEAGDEQDQDLGGLPF